mgnify:CR=1 FL=1
MLKSPARKGVVAAYRGYVWETAKRFWHKFVALCTSDTHLARTDAVVPSFFEHFYSLRYEYTNDVYERTLYDLGNFNWARLEPLGSLKFWRGWAP